MSDTLYGHIDDANRHILSCCVQYEDTDFSGFVYHANYLKFAERGRSNALRLIGITHSDLLALDAPLAFVVSRMEMDFVRPAVLARGCWLSSASAAPVKRSGKPMCWRRVWICKGGPNVCRATWRKS